MTDRDKKGLSELKPEHYQAMILRQSGLKHAEIAQELHKASGTIRNWFADPLFSNEYEQLTSKGISQAKDIITGAAPKAAKRVIKLMNEDGAVGLNAARDILDRAGLKPTNKHEVESNNPIEHQHNHKLDLSSLSDEELNALESIYTKLEASGKEQSNNEVLQ